MVKSPFFVAPSCFWDGIRYGGSICFYLIERVFLLHHSHEQERWDVHRVQDVRKRKPYSNAGLPGTVLKSLTVSQLLYKSTTANQPSPHQLITTSQSSHLSYPRSCQAYIESLLGSRWRGCTTSCWQTHKDLETVVTSDTVSTLSLNPKTTNTYIIHCNPVNVPIITILTGNPFHNPLNPISL
jgi:hypothetical protein